MVSTWESSKSWRVCDQIETLGTDMLPKVKKLKMISYLDSQLHSQSLKSRASIELQTSTNSNAS